MKFTLTIETSNERTWIFGETDHETVEDQYGNRVGTRSYTP